MNNKDSIDQLMQGYRQAFRKVPDVIYMNKSYLEQFNKDLSADSDRDLKKYKGSDIVLWQNNFVSLGKINQ